ncbi:PREDICTED: G-type lectin S-receptor-like serine/threonine-protein kinase At1g67520 [Ipomoea nil]|uniref:G-type lectin S-receptor-like serine/threonine-protein kinase At1g67520 n=1 Tax=Ipomoea nil TaxID=35883 RepID=UPI000900A88D|nr:PREDICTED: G-type lectin S-receptor-like serine/threonine-protein kinase At1g67520 [Ipomoea nil]
MDSSKIFLLILLISFLQMGFSSYVSIAAESDTLKQGAKIRDWEHLTSAKAIFKLGFFSISAGYSGPNNLENHYLGIWYTNVPNQPVWIANRDSPLPDSSGSLIIDAHGKLKISYVGGMITVSNVSTMSGNNVGATLLDSGNLVVREVDGNGRFGGVLWQSFDYPTDVLLPGMKLGVNLKTGHVWKLTSWLSDQVPGSGAFELGLDVNGGTNQLVVSRRGKVYWTSGVWKNGSFEKAPDVTEGEMVLGFKFMSNEKEKYFSYSAKHNDMFTIWKLHLLGQIEQSFLVIFNMRERIWTGSYASECRPSLERVCLKENPVSCRKSSDVFVETRGHFDDGNISYVKDSPNGYRLALSDCHSICWKNCSCTAYASYSTDGTGCILYTNAHNFKLAAIHESYIYRLIKEHKS